MTQHPLTKRTFKIITLHYLSHVFGFFFIAATKLIISTVVSLTHTYTKIMKSGLCLKIDNYFISMWTVKYRELQLQFECGPQSSSAESLIQKFVCSCYLHMSFGEDIIVRWHRGDGAPTSDCCFYKKMLLSSHALHFWPCDAFHHQVDSQRALINCSFLALIFQAFGNVRNTLLVFINNLICSDFFGACS